MSRTSWQSLQARGSKVFNQWRADHPRAHPNFAGMIFHKQASFAEFNLSCADLHGGKFKHANFRSADLRGADLSRAYLGYANFRDADLRGANLRGSDLRDAFLERARLENADLSGALLRNANLTETTMGETVFANVDLSSVKGLTRVKHIADSIIDIATIYRSHGRIPDAFLRGVGVPKKTISHVRGISKQQAHVSVFVSYSSKDKDVVELVVHDLKEVGVRCFYASYDLQAGETFPERIVNEIRSVDSFLLMLSKNSLDSGWVARELETAQEAQKQGNSKLRIIPVRLDAALIRRESLPAWADALKKTTHVLNFSPNRRGHGYWQALVDLTDTLAQKTE